MNEESWKQFKQKQKQKQKQQENHHPHHEPSLYYLCYVHSPTLALPYAIGKHLYLPNCEPSSDSIQDLFVTPSMTPEEAKEQTERHGVAFVEQVLSPATASNLRQYILKANYEIEGTFIKENENRFHIIPDPMMAADAEVAESLPVSPSSDIL
ncbi:unnamed protein product [Cylindrotheca closterium]|uniref:Uncharacterized protein n=1 Tax=Cylindrotheca closterium TaxID=2856 RepID=A0AAD2CNY4_9STRA|nr:unnamed protein product [Cylindrotheca closterium]